MTLHREHEEVAILTSTYTSDTMIEAMTPQEAREVVAVKDEIIGIVRQQMPDFPRMDMLEDILASAGALLTFLRRKKYGHSTTPDPRSH